MNKTTIEWAQNPDGSQGYTWNPLTGCLNHDKGLCKGGGFPCYAYKLAHGRLKQRYLGNSNWCHWNPPENGYYDPFYPRLWENRLYQIRGEGTYDNCYPDRNAYHASREKEKGIFVCDMGDLFGIGIPEEWTKRVLKQCKEFSQHRFYLLTKQAQRLPAFSPFPDNCWVGVTATNTEMLMRACSHLEDVRAKMKYLSLEPLLAWDFNWNQSYLVNTFERADIRWLIIGACTGTYAEMWKLGGVTDRVLPFGKRCTLQPSIEWLREIVEAADKAGIPVFLKDNLSPLIQAHFGEIRNQLCTLIGEEVELRQEIPK